MRRIEVAIFHAKRRIGIIFFIADDIEKGIEYICSQLQKAFYQSCKGHNLDLHSTALQCDVLVEFNVDITIPTSIPMSHRQLILYMEDNSFQTKRIGEGGTDVFFASLSFLIVEIALAN